MANPEKYPPPVMAAKFGIGKLTRPFVYLPWTGLHRQRQGEKTWEYIKSV